MHFWIDKRQSCGFGGSRARVGTGGGFGHYPRRPRPSNKPTNRTTNDLNNRPHIHRSNLDSESNTNYLQNPQYYTHQPPMASLGLTNSVVISNQNLNQISNHNSTDVNIESDSEVVSRPEETQLLSAHLKCGMWGALALATIFVAGGQFYNGHTREVLIFFALSVALMTACSVSLCCKRPRKFPTSNSPNTQAMPPAESFSNNTITDYSTPHQVCT